MKPRSPFNFDPDVDSFKSGISFDDCPSLTQQHMKDETDINVMIHRFSKLGGMPPAPDAPAFFDAGEPFDYQTAMNQVRAAQESFNALPSSLREKFLNDPGRLMAFLSDPANLEEARSLGLVKPAPEPTPTPTPVDSTPPASE